LGEMFRGERVSNEGVRGRQIVSRFSNRKLSTLAAHASGEVRV